MTETLYLKTFEDGLPFFDEIYNEETKTSCIQKELDLLYERLLIRKPVMIIIDGNSGDGKTTLAIEIADYYNKKIGKPPVNFNGSQYAKGGKDFTKKIRQCHDEGFCCSIYDEGGDLNRKTTLSKFNRTMDMVFNQSRVYDQIVILITQSVGYLENDLFTKGIIRILFNCHGRKDKIKSNFRKYEIDRINYLRQAIKKEVTPTKAYQKISPNTHGIFYNISQKRDEELHQIGFKKKDEDISQGDLINDGLIDYETISHKTGQSLITTRLKIKKLGIKPERFHKKKAYFKQNIIERLNNNKKYNK